MKEKNPTQWLKDYLEPMFQKNNLPVSVDTSFDSLGLDSVTRVEMIGGLEEALGMDLDPTLGFEYPTIASLSQYVTAQGND
ncbi:acyl carrier protein [Vibrio quintilis]|uniref:Phenolphthiocerol synthesis polyketide synthase type I Pks15/1 n=1 Tax=Vibrio quintilis TaxID=1117707 RepID=A0A1M7YVJ2_9VIBR|nr:acyl carrier protein [Vibrio quintilis]SHO56625.1 Phenolphthiocerol synthesis polyketide synthase type I Pks15/1 [Vibrio quintilis]